MITFDDEMNKLPSERREKIEAKTKELLQEMQLIEELRQRLGLSSQEDMKDPNNLQQQLTLEKLTQMIGELGGEWELTVKFPDTQAIKLTNHFK